MCAIYLISNIKYKRKVKPQLHKKKMKIPKIGIVKKRYLTIKKIRKKRKYKISKIQKYNKIVILYIVILCASVIYVNEINRKYNEKYLNLNNSNLNIVATIVEDIEEKDYKYICTIKIESINKSTKYKGTLILLNIKKNENDVVNYLKYGNKITFKGEYSEPSRERNYKGFNYNNYLKTKKIYGTITLQNVNTIKILKENNVNLIDRCVQIVKEKIKVNLKEVLSSDTYALATGILIGYTNEINEEVIQDFKNSNLSHMLAISGAHTNYIILAINILFAKKLIGTRNQKIIIIIFLLIFMKLTGMTPSVVRAGTTCIVYMIASLTFRKADTINTISISTLIILISNPFNLFNIGMQLSYAGCISILLFFNILEEKITTSNKFIKYIIENLFITISANILIIPIMWYNFNTISLTFMFSNLLAGPILGVSIILDLVTILVSFISIEVASLPALILDFFLKLIMKIAEIFGSLTISTIVVITPSLIAIILYYIFCITIIIERKYKILEKYKGIIIKIIAISTICVIVVDFNIIPPINSKMCIYFIDVGQGDSTLIKTPKNRTILIDGGGSNFEGGFDVGNKVLIPYLLDRKIHKINYIIISHFDSDHCRRNT